MLQQRPGRVFAAVPRQTSRPLVQPPNRVPSREASPQPSPLHSSLLGRTTPSRPAMTPEPGSGAMTPETPVHLQMPSVLPSSGSRVSTRGTTRLVAPVRNSCELASASSSNSRSSPTPRVWETLTRTRTPPLKPADSRSMSAVASQQNMKPGHLPSRPGRQEIRKPVLRQGSLHERMKPQVATSSSPRAPMNVADEHLAFANACSVPSCGGASRLLQKRKTHPGQRSLKGASTRTPPRFLKTPDTNQFAAAGTVSPAFCGNVTPPASGSLTPPFYVSLTPNMDTGADTPVSSGPWYGEAIESSHIFEDPPGVAGDPSGDQENAAPACGFLHNRENDRKGLSEVQLDDGLGVALSPTRPQKGDTLKSVLRAEILPIGPLMEFDLNSPTYGRPRKSLEGRLSMEGRARVSLNGPSICLEGRPRLSDHSSVSFELSPDGGKGASTALSVGSLTSNGFSLSDSAPSSASATSVTVPSSDSRRESKDDPDQGRLLVDGDDLECNCEGYPSARDATDLVVPGVDVSDDVTPVAVASVTDNAVAENGKDAVHVKKVVDLCSLWESRCGDSAKRMSRSRGEPRLSGESTDANAIVQDGRSAPRRKSGQFARCATEMVRKRRKEGRERTDVLVRRLAERIKEVTGAEDIECESSDSEALGVSPKRAALSRDEEFCQEFMNNSSANWKATRKMVRAALKALSVQSVPAAQRCSKCGYPDGPDRASSSSSPRENAEDPTLCFYAKCDTIRRSLSPKVEGQLLTCTDSIKKALQEDQDTNTSRQEPAGEPRPLDSSREEPFQTADNEDPSFLHCEVVEIVQEAMSPIAAVEGDIADTHSASDSDGFFEESFFDPAGYPRPKEESIEWAATLLHQLEQEEMEKELRLLVPAGMGPGRTVSFMYENRRHEVAIPEGCEVGQEVPIRMYKMPFLQKTPELAWARGQQDDRYTVLDSLKHCTRAPAEECNFASADMQNRINLYKLLRGSSVAPLLPYTPEDEVWSFDADRWGSDGESDVV